MYLLGKSSLLLKFPPHAVFLPAYCFVHPQRRYLYDDGGCVTGSRCVLRADAPDVGRSGTSFLKVLPRFSIYGDSSRFRRPFPPIFHATFLFHAVSTPSPFSSICCSFAFSNSSSCLNFHFSFTEFPLFGLPFFLEKMLPRSCMFLMRLCEYLDG